MKWKKLGQIITPQFSLDWMITHAMLPTADHLEGDIYRVYFSGRDSNNRSLIGSADIDLTNTNAAYNYSSKPVLGLGDLGCFDDNGVTPTAIITSEAGKYLYYVGWKPRSTTRFSLVAGLAISTDDGQTFRRYSQAPILHTNNNEPISILTAPCVMKDENQWRMWYVSGVRWENPDLPIYNIKYASSKDGLHWHQGGEICIDNREGESALARPCVIKDEGLFKMWYSFKYQGETYRIGYAESEDAINWVRKDQEAGITVSERGWDSEMIEYGFVFKHSDKKYMLYNGNGYGECGAGLAILEE